MNRLPPLPEDVDFPELDDESKAIADKLHAEFKASSKLIRERVQLNGRRPATPREVWQLTHPGTDPPAPGHNAEALRELTPYQRAVYRYIFTRED
jgi:hypothetical protein